MKCWPFSFFISFDLSIKSVANSAGRYILRNNTKVLWKKKIGDYMVFFQCFICVTLICFMPASSKGFVVRSIF